MRKRIDQFIETTLLFLVIFTPLAFGGVQPWSVAVMEIMALSIFFLHVIQTIIRMPMSRSDRKIPALRIFFSAECALCVPPLLLLSAGLILLILFQMLPLPQYLLQTVSSSTWETYQNLGQSASDAWHPVTIHADATRRELFRILSGMAVFWVIVSRYRTRDQVDRLLEAIIFTALFLVVFALIQKMTWNGRIFWIYPVEAFLNNRGTWGPYINRNHFAGYLEMVIPLCAGLLLYLTPSTRFHRSHPARSGMLRFMAGRRFLTHTLMFLLVLILIAGLFLTFSRGGILAFACSASFFAGITFRRRSLKARTILLGFLALVVFLAVVIAARENLEIQFMNLAEDHVHRLAICQDACNLFWDYPLFGTGAGTFKNAYMRFQTHSPTDLYDHAHNDFVEVITDMGGIGFLLLAAMAVLFFKTAFQRWQYRHGMYSKCIGAGGLASCLALAVHSATDFNLHIPANALLFSVVAGITWAVLFNLPGETDMPS